MNTENDKRGGVREIAVNVEHNEPLTPLFPMGVLVLKKGVRAKLPFRDVVGSLTRHGLGEWGNLDELDRRINNNALHTGKRLWSAHRASNGVKFWIITNANRSATAVLLPKRIEQ